MSGDTRRARQVAAEAPWPSFALPSGTTVNGYRIERILGSGGFGITYLATDLLGQQFAIKEYYPQQFATRRDMTVEPNTVENRELFDECKERFLREAHALVRLGGVAGAADGIVRVQTYFEAFGTGFLVMEYIAGESLAAVLLRDPGGLPPERVRSLLLQLLASVRIVHHAGLVHRDIKPANIILRENDRLVLIDFGATRHATPTDTTNFSRIYSGGYGPPEQMLGLRQGEFSDIYAIGAVCYRAIGGRVVNSLARQNSLAAGLADPLAPAVEMAAERYPRPLLAVIDAALSVDPAQRPQTVDAMLTLLGAEHTPTLRTTKHAAPKAPPQWSRSGWAAAIAASVVVVAGVVYLLVLPSAPPPVSELREPGPHAPPRDEVELRGAPPPPSPQAPEPQRETVLVTPPAVSAAVPVPLDRVQSLAAALSCAALNVAGSNDAVRVSGLAAGGPELDRLLADARDAGRVIDAVTRVDRFACPTLTIVAPLVRRAGNSGASKLALRVEQGGVAVGGRLGVSVATTRPAAYLDLYQPDGSVRHLLHPAQFGTTGHNSTEWTATPPAGPRLLVAMAADDALALGPRAETERTSDYLEILRARLADGPPDVLGDLAMVMVRPAEPVVAKSPPRQNNVRSERCANIISRAQLGETLSNAELAALQSECRS